jgi:hypothetical protein
MVICVQDSFASCVEYFGEAPRGCDANAFFSLLVRFARAFKVRNTTYFILTNPFDIRVVFNRQWLSYSFHSRIYTTKALIIIANLV